MAAGQGGRELFIKNLSHGLARIGHEVHLFMDSEGVEQPFHTQTIESGVAVHRFTIGSASAPGALMAFIQLLDAISPDIVHAHNTHDTSQFFLHAYLRRVNIPLVLSLHDIEAIAARNTLEERTNLVIAPSRYMEDRYKQGIRADAKVAFIPHGVELQRSHNDNDELSVLFAGHIAQHKGLLQLINAWSTVAAEFSEATLKIVGDGPDRRFFEDYAARSSERVNFLGWLPQREVMDLLGSNTVVVVPSMIPEAFGLIAVEAMAAASPVIATTSGGLPEIVEDERSGFLVSPSSSLHIAEKLRLLLSENELRIEMGQAGRVRAAQNFDYAVMLTRYVDAYRDLL